MTEEEKETEDLEVLDAPRHVDTSTSAVKEIFREFANGIDKRDPSSLFILFCFGFLCILTIIFILVISIALWNGHTVIVSHTLNILVAIVFLIVITAALVTIFLSKFRNEYELAIAAANQKNRK